jgi:hypothetical protein
LIRVAAWVRGPGSRDLGPGPGPWVVASRPVSPGPAIWNVGMLNSGSEEQVPRELKCRMPVGRKLIRYSGKTEDVLPHLHLYLK